KIVIATGNVTTFAGSGTAAATDGTGTAASLSYPVGITTDGTYLYVTGDARVRKISIATRAVTTLAGSGTPGLTNATGTAAQFNEPFGITTDGSSLFVADRVNNVIRKIQ
ncbi:MAG: hypothetical protein PHH58_14345, partial [Rhodoferax sp.]|nr:hypothetical protein [Rhodoferax sp.]